MTRKIHPQFRENQISDAPSRGNCARIDCGKRANTAPPDCPATAFESSASEIPVKTDSTVDRIAGLGINTANSGAVNPRKMGAAISRLCRIQDPQLRSGNPAVQDPRIEENRRGLSAVWSHPDSANRAILAGAGGTDPLDEPQICRQQNSVTATRSQLQPLRQISDWGKPDVSGSFFNITAILLTAGTLETALPC